MRRLLYKPCERCGKRFGFRPDHVERAKYCSRSCRSLTVARATAVRRGDKMRGTGQGRAYRKLGGRHEHRVVAERKIGRPLQRGEVVHHVDGNILNNHPDNLAVMTAAAHMRQHGIGIPGQRPSWMQSEKPR